MNYLEYEYLHNKRRYVCLSVCLFVCCLWPAERLGRSRPNLSYGLVLTQGVFKSRSFGATWQMLIKLVTEARKGRENSINMADRGPQGRDNSGRRTGTFS